MLLATLALLPVAPQAHLLATPDDPAPEPSIPYPVETSAPAADARAALFRCVKGAMVQSWHMNCVIRSIWGPRRSPHDPPPSHSVVFLRAALAEATAQTEQHRTRENAVYALLASRFDNWRQNVSYGEFLNALVEAFHALPAPSPPQKPAHMDKRHPVVDLQPDCGSC
ncbi:hypothetical protein ACFQU7_37125 [Pseudoroseomonas wenyumeiae]